MVCSARKTSAIATENCDNHRARQNAISKPTPSSVIAFSSSQSERLRGAMAITHQKTAKAPIVNRAIIGCTVELMEARLST